MRTARTRIIVLWMLVLQAVAISAVQANQPNKITWDQLPQRLAERSEPLQLLPACDCPDDVDEREPSRVVAQVIENTFYLWEEYDIVYDSGETDVCVVMRQPESLVLTTEEALVLLTASDLWQVPQEPTTDYTVLDANDPELDLLAPQQWLSEEGNPAIQDEHARRRTLGPDDRSCITTTTEFPWNTVCFLAADFPGRHWRGSACVVSPHMVLTCGHMIFDRRSDQWAQAMEIFPAQVQREPGGQVERPYGSRSMVRMSTNTRFVQSEEHSSNDGRGYDYGAAFFERPFAQIATYIPLEFQANLTTDDIVTVTGYPKVVQGIQNSYGMWYDSHYIGFIGGDVLEYYADTSGGNSGGPVWWYSATTGQLRIVAVHAYSRLDVPRGGGTRLSPANQGLITEWMQWAPDFIDDAYEVNNTPEQAYDLTAHSGQWISDIAGAGKQADDDWFRFELPDGRHTLTVRCLFTHARGDIDMEVFGPDGELLAFSRSETDHEDIQAETTGGFHYVVLYYGDQGNAYDLQWRTHQATSPRRPRPAPTPDCGGPCGTGCLLALAMATAMLMMRMAGSGTRRYRVAAHPRTSTGERPLARIDHRASQQS